MPRYGLIIWQYNMRGRHENLIFLLMTHSTVLCRLLMENFYNWMLRSWAHAISIHK
jgi:hypothetical protein